MPRFVCILLLALIGAAAHADVLDHQHSTVAQFVHQTLGVHHLPFTLLLIAATVLVIRSWRAAGK